MKDAPREFPVYKHPEEIAGADAVLANLPDGPALLSPETVTVVCIRCDRRGEAPAELVPAGMNMVGGLILAMCPECGRAERMSSE